MSDVRFRITYRPEGVDTPKEWVVDVLDGLRASELIALKKASGGSINGVTPLILGISDLDGEAVKGIVWLMLKREMSTLAWDSLDFPIGAVTIESADDLTPGQIRGRLERLQAQGNMNAAGEAELARLIAAGVQAEDEVTEDPKA